MTIHSNPLGNDFIPGTTDSTLGRVSTGGQSENVAQDEAVHGTTGVARTDISQIGDTTTVIAEQDAPQSVPDPSNPALPPPEDYDQSQVMIKEVMKNLGINEDSDVGKWFSSYLTTMSVNFAEIAKLAKDIHKAEGKMATQSMAMIWAMAQDTANLIMAKAQTEANMHIALAVSAMVGLGIAIAGAALSLGGSGKMSKAKAAKADLGSGANTAPKVGQARAGGMPVGSTAAKPTPPRPNVEAPFGRPVDAQVGPTYRPIRPKTPAPERPVQANAPDPVAANAPADPKTISQKIQADKADGRSMQMVGQAVTQASGSIRDMIDNIIQAVMKLEIGKFDSAIELARARRELATKALDSAIQAFGGSTDMLNDAMRAYDKAVDSSIEANRIGSR